MAVPDISLLYNYKGTAYPVQLATLHNPGLHNNQPVSRPVKKLLDLCCNKIVKDSTTTLRTLQSVPSELYYSLMKAAVHSGNNASIDVLISNWPWDILSLQKFAPCLFDDIKVLYNDTYLNEKIKKGVNYTTCLAHTFVECLKKRSPTKLKSLDLSGYPAAEVIVNYLSSHVLLVYNEARQKDIITAYKAVTKDLPEENKTHFKFDTTLPDESYIVIMDAFLQTTDTHMELCKALRVSSKPKSTFKLCLNKLDIMCLGLARIRVLLEEVDPKYLTALCLQFNGLCNDALSLLVPVIQNFQHLTALDISCNSINISSESMEHSATKLVTDMLSNLPNLCRLDLSNNRTKSRLSQILSAMPQKLEYLKLCGCGISESDLTYLKNSHHAQALRELDISGNDISQFFSKVLDVLSTLHCSLLVLEMEECELSASAILDFFHTFHHFECLRYLNISRNKPWTESVLDEGLVHFVQNLGLDVVRVSYPVEYCSLSNPNYLEEDVMDYTQKINEKVESFCSRLHRPILKIAFLP